MNAYQTQFVFIDPTVPQPEQLLLGLPAYITAIYLNNHTDAIEQITGHLRGKQHIDALHIVTHGSPGRLHFSSTSLSIDTLNQYWDQLASWSRFLTDGADILLYGCDTGQGIKGNNFLETLTAITGLNIKAASEKIGRTENHVNWELTELRGDVSTPVFISDQAKAIWQHKLAAPADQNFNSLNPAYRSTSYDVGGITYTMTALTGREIITMADPGNFSAISDIGLIFNAKTVGSIETKTNGAFTFTIKTTDGSDFKLVGMQADVSNVSGYVSNITIAGYRDSNSVVTEDVNFSVSDSAGSVTYTNTGGNGGNLSFNSDWQNIDEIRFTGGSSTTAGVLMIDDLDFEAAIAGPPNTTPSLTVANLSYTEGDTSRVDSGASASDAEGDSDWDTGAKLEVQITANHEAADQLSIGTVGGITLSGVNVQYNDGGGAVTIGTIAETSGTSNDGTVTNGDKLTINFVAAATDAAVQALVQAIQYSTTSDEPGTSDRTITFTLTDKNGGAKTDTSTVTVTAVNDAPTLTATGSNPTYIEGSSAEGVFTGASVSTVETGQNIESIVFTVSNVSGDGSTEHITLDGSEFALSNTTGSPTTAGNGFGYAVALNTGTKVATITVTKTATAANYQTLIDGIQYRNSGTGLDGNDRVFAITSVQDSGGTSNSGVDTATLSGGSAVESTVSTQAAPAIASATYNYSTNQLVVTGTNFVSSSGGANDVDLSLLTFTGEGGNTYTLTTSTDVEIDSATQFTVTLSGADVAHVEALLNADGAQAADGSTTYNLAAADNWMAGAVAAVDIADASNGITVSGYAAPVIASSTYNFSTGELVLTGTNFVANASGDDVDVTKLTFTGENGATYTLSSGTSNVNITSDTAITITLGAADRLNVNGLLNKDGAQADDGTNNYNLAAAEDWLTGAAASLNIADATSSITVSGYAAPTIASATYDSDTGELVVTGTNFVKQPGANNDIDISLITLTGEGGSHQLTSASDVEITSATSFTITLAGSDKAGVDARLDQIGTISSGGATYNIAVADNWLAGAPATANIADTINNAITVQIPPKITSATYNADTGELVVTGSNIQAQAGASNDIDASLFTFTGEGGATYTLIGTSDVERTSANSFTLTLDATDKAAINQMLNKDGASSTGGTSFNLSVADDWNTAVTAGDTADATNTITVSNVPAPTIASVTYDASTGALVVTGSGFLKLTGATNDIDVTKLSLLGEGSESHTLTSDNVEITSATEFTVMLNAADRAAIGLFMNKDGADSTSGTAYNLAAAEDWAAGAAASVNVADLTGNAITVSNVPTPTIASATYNGKTGVLVVTGTNFLKKDGATNDIDVTKLILAGEGGSHTLTSGNVEITSATEFTVTLNTTDKNALSPLLNKAGTTSNNNTTYNLNAAEDWAAGANSAENVVDATGNGITVTLNSAPTSADTTESVAYNGTYTFQANDFAFTDTDNGDSLQSIKIVSVPSDGSLTLNSNPLNANDDVTATQLNNGLLKFSPASGGTGNNYTSFTFTVSDGTDSSATPNTVTLNVAAPPPPSSGGGTPSPTTPTKETVDGVTVTTETQTDSQGETIKVIKIDPVSDSRTDEDSTSQNADVPLHFADETGQQVVTTISLPNGVGIEARANDSARAQNQNQDLIDLINETAGGSESGREEMAGLGQTFLDQIGQAREQVWVNQINLTRGTGATASDQPIVLTGSQNTGDSNSAGYQEAVVINMRQLPSGTQLVLNDIEFAVIVGDGQIIRGGEGANTVMAGSGSQDIVLGADDDKLYGGDGDDTVGSKGGDDLIFGQNGNDTLFGGAGKDQLHGGLNGDTATFEGNREAYEVVRKNGVVTVTSKADNTDVDTLINVEKIQFADQTDTVEYETDLSVLATIYQKVLGRQADLGGFQWWAESIDNGLALGDAAVSIMRSAEAEQRMGSALNDLSNDAQVEALYTQILGRASDAEGKAFWLDALNNGTNLEQIAQGFAHSSELQQSYLSAESWNFFV